MLDEKQIQKQMKYLGVTREEAIKIVQDDLDIDRGLPKPWDLTEEQLKNQRKLCNATTRKTTKPSTRTRKENLTKQAIISFLANSLNEFETATEVNISNAERVIDFVGEDGVNYSLTLTAHRK